MILNGREYGTLRTAGRERELDAALQFLDTDGDLRRIVSKVAPRQRERFGAACAKLYGESSHPAASDHEADPIF